MKDLQPFFTLLNKTFDRIYLITLQRATDRHEHVYKELEGLKYEFFYGHDKLSFDIEGLKQQGIYDEGLARKHHRYGKPMPPGMIGCSWSHAEVYRDAVTKGYKTILILEDDVVIDKATASLLPQVLAAVPTDWQLLYFGFTAKEKASAPAFFKKFFYHFLRFFGAINYSHTTIRNLYPKKVNKHIFRAGYHDGTHAYAITLEGARKLLQLQTPISFFPDNLLAYAATNELLKAYIVLPKLINQQYQVGISSASYIND